MPTRQAIGAMQPMFKVPDDAVPELQSVLAEYGIEHDVQREYLTALDVVSDLPAYRTPW